MHNLLNNTSEIFISKFSTLGSEVYSPEVDEFNKPGWSNRIWTSPSFKSAHINIINALDTKGLWMMHCCIFPHNHNNSPIFGFDIFAGKNKITGCFHDYSPVITPHELLTDFERKISSISWNKQRELPEWAQSIFSQNIMAAGNIQDISELSDLCQFITSSLDHYLQKISLFDNTTENSSDIHKFYCSQQQKNPHNPRVLMSLGLSEPTASQFITTILFPYN